jgi:signal transduction histidine kinase
MNGPDALTGERQGGWSALPGAGTETVSGDSPGLADGQAADGGGSDPGTEHSGRRAKAGRKTRGADRPARLSLSNWPVPVRLTTLVVVASVTGLVFGGLRVADAVSNSASYGRTVQLARLGEQATSLAQAMENERDRSSGVAAYTVLASDAAANNAGPSVTGPIQSALAAEKKQLAVAESQTDAAARQTSALATTIGAAFPPSAQSEALTVVSMITSIHGLRGQVAGQPATAVIAGYSHSIADLFGLDDEITIGSGDAQLAEAVRALGALSRAKDEASQQRAFLYSALIETSVDDAGGHAGTAPSNTVGLQSLADAGGIGAFDTAQGMQTADLADFNDAATSDESNAYQDTMTSQQAGNVQLIESSVSEYGDPRLTFEHVGDQTSLGLSQDTVAATWYSDMSAVISDMRQIESQDVNAIVTRSQSLQRYSTNSAVLTAALTVLALLLALLATVLVGRTLVKPLRRLQSDALDIATRRLPARVAAAASGTELEAATAEVEPVGVHSTDEIGRVARAFDQVHAEAVRLAGNEAQLRGSLNAMFISLSRRSVPLIDRLARMIDGMEQSEDDPDQLGNLFSMDHLVTRMRRNSENLLVLAGEEPVRKWTDSVPLADVTRAAAAEIEQYNRVTLTGHAGVVISGQGAADVVHLLAELIENATLFSPQHTQVRVTVTELSTGGVLVEVRDDGVGVSPARLADMNWRLDNPPALDVSISRHMGLYAVSHLAARHGIRVKLRPGTPQGLSALIWLPSTLTRQEQVPPARAGSAGRFRPARAFGAVDAVTVPAADPGPVTPAAGTPRLPAGRHRSGPLSASGEQPRLGGEQPRASGAQPHAGSRRGQQARPPTVWFTAKRPSEGTVRSTGELAASWQPGPDGAGRPGPARPGTGYGVGGLPGDGLPGDGLPGDGGRAREEAGQTSAGLPRRVPRASTAPGPGTPDRGLPAAPGDDRVPVLSAPAAHLLRPPPTPFTPFSPGTRRNGPAPEPARGERMPDRRRSPEEARSRLSGFQLGSRDAVEASPEPRPAPHAEEGSTR